MAGFGDPQILELMREVWKRPSYSVYQRVGRRLDELKADVLPERAGRRKVRLAILSSFTIDPIVPYLQVGCVERDILAEIFLPGFNQFAQQLLNPESELYAFRPDICYLHLLPEALVSGTQFSGFSGDHITALLDSIRNHIAAFRRDCQGDLVISNFAAPSRFPYSLQRDEAAELNRELNLRLEKIAGEMPGVYVLDYEALTGFHGKGAIADERLRHLARMEIGHQMLPKLANKMLAHMIALRGFGKKCLVLDLDNTLWGGNVGDDGLTGIQLGEEYPGSAFVEFQHSLLALYQRGVILTVNSKNNDVDALDVLKHHPAMVLRAEHFSAMRINWRDKCENIEAIATELNLGLESMVFIDDNPAERELMRRLRSEVLTPEWPEDPVLYRSALEGLCDFATVSVTAEDLRRSEMYVDEGKRDALKERSGTLEEYLFGLNMQVWFNEAEGVDIPRVTQLVQRTNQFNLTTRRYSSSEIEGFLRADNASVYVLRNRDAFGDNGLVGVAVVVEEIGDDGGRIWRIDSLLMSCRVLGRTIEDVFLHFLSNKARREGAQYVVGEFNPTNKNMMVKDFYREAGFRPAEVSETGSRWILDLASYTPPTFPWMSINAAPDVPTRSKTMTSRERHHSGIG